MADVTYYVAMPFLQDDSGTPVAGAAEECQSPTTALRRAETMSRMAGSIGAVAFSRSGDPMMGEFSDAKLLRNFGNVPDDLSGFKRQLLHAPASRDASCRRNALRTYMALSAASSARPASEWVSRTATPAEAPAVMVRPSNTKVRRSISSSSVAALARASVSLRFHNSSANSSPPSRPTTSEARTCASSVVTIGLEHLVACGMSEGVVDRLQAIDVEHDERAAGTIAFDVGDRAIELALEAAPVRNAQQEVGIGGGLKFLDLRLRLGQLRLQPANCRLGVVGRRRRPGYWCG